MSDEDFDTEGWYFVLDEDGPIAAFASAARARAFVALQCRGLVTRIVRAPIVRGPGWDAKEME